MPKKELEISEIEKAMGIAGFWEDKKRAREMSQELAVLKKEKERWDVFFDEIKTLKELLEILVHPVRSPAMASLSGKEGEADLGLSPSSNKSAFQTSNGAKDEQIIKEIEERIKIIEKNLKIVEIETLFAGKYDKGNAVLSVYAGAGGKDSEDWAALLLRMYRRFAEKKGWKSRTLHEHWGESSGPAGWGIKNATILIEAPFSYGYLKNESGVHRLVRISPFSSQSLRHTSFALVDVMPEFVAPEEVEINPDDLKIDFFRSSGPGGQNVNKRETAVRITHLPTGLQAASQSERTQERNREIAMELLRSRLYAFKLKQQEQERQGVRKEKVAIEWGSQIRSYVMHPYQMVKDHRTEVETSNIEKVLDGGLDEFIDAELHKS
ncbi:MAG: Peptide chain release factor 2 [Parcubacteria group bacterium GW2011_GWA2_42_14]|nr:MAG: Peptide chain release factor 2 [Parcubacteria group bacterium GW2011_GWA2_42_14]